MSGGAAVELIDLLKTYGAIAAVDGVSLHVGAGEFVTLLGASGSGKTTTLMMIAGFVIPDRGAIRIGDQEISRWPPERRGLGVVFQSYALFPHLTVHENVAFPLRLRRMPEREIGRRVGDALALVDLAEFGKRRIAQLSGGQQQRVALARAIVFSPPVLLMDEPLGALDRKLRDQLQGEIKRIQRDLGVTVVYVTHDQEEALALSDRVAIMRQGRIAQLGTPDDVYEHPASPFVASFLGESNFVPVEFVARAGKLAQVRPLAAPEIPLFAAVAEARPPGTRLLAMVRPEAFGIPRADAQNRLAVTVRTRDFLGATVRFSVSSPIGELVVRLPRLHQHATPAPGAKLELSWAAEETLLYPE